MRVLVTGGAGFIGSHFCERLIQKTHQVVCLDNFNDYYDPEIKRRNVASLRDHSHFDLIEGDILDTALLDKLGGSAAFDIVVHLAARAGVRPSIQQPLLYQRVNVEGTTNLLEFCVRNHIPKIVIASSSSVYGGNEKVPFSEKDPVDHPISPYAATKRACELMAYTYYALHGLSATCLRFFTVYGPRQRPDMAIHKFTRLIHDGKPVPVFGDGSSRRDYTYISDIIQGVEQSVERCEGYHIYNLGESKTIRLKDLIPLIEDALGKKAILDPRPDQPGDVPATYADIRRAEADLDYRPSVPVKEGVPRFVRWYLRRIGKAG